MSSITDHYIAAICRRGHVVSNDALAEVEARRRCGECGARVFTACPGCEAPVLGPLRHAVYAVAWKPDEFCWHCGLPCPWASQASIANHIENLLEEQPDLPDGDRRALAEQLKSLREPAGNAEVERRQIRALEAFKRLAPKAWERALPLVMTIATAEIKRQLALP
jgi:hypothetical protein